MKKTSFALILSMSLFQTLNAADFTIEDGETVNTQQVLSDKGDKGKIEEGGTLATGASTAVVMQNKDQKLRNYGQITTTGDLAHGVRSSEKNASIKNTGSIETSGDNAYGILSVGQKAKIKNKGEITTNGGISYGIISQGDDSNIKNYGEITTLADDAIGIFSQGLDEKVTNKGLIETSGVSAHGIFRGLEGGKVKNKGEISTVGDDAYGIYGTRINANIKNEGEITTAGTRANGIYTTEVDAKIKNSGEITIIGDLALGIFSQGANVEIENSGEITINGSGEGILSQGANAKIKNTGKITTSEDGAGGITNQSSSSGAKIENSGEISTDGESAYAIFNSASDVRIENSGEITTTGANGFGIFKNAGTGARIDNSGRITTSEIFTHAIINFNGDATIKNTGEITTIGDEAYAIFSRGTGDWIDNSGELIAKGVDAYAIFSIAPDLQITNSGIIKSEQSLAIFLNNTNPTLTLKRGSNIQGGVSTSSALNLYVKKGLNLDLTIEGAGGFGDIGIDDPYVIDGLNVVVADRSGFALQADFLADLSDAVLGGKPVNDCCYDPCGGGFWLAGIGSYRDRSSKDRIVGIRNEQAGLLFGYDTSLCSGNAGIFGAVMFGNPEVSRHTQHADTTSYIAGLNYSKAYCGTCYGLSVAGGYVDWENRRHVMNNLIDGGEETGKANLDGTFISAELSLSEQVCCLPCSPTMSVIFRYAGLYFGDYSEKGIEAPLSVKDRNIDLLTTRVEFAFTENPYNAFCLCIEPYFGFYGRYQLRGKRVDAELLDEELSFTQGNHHSLAAVLFGIRATKEWNANTLFMNLETDFDNRRSSRVIGELGVRF